MILWPALSGRALARPLPARAQALASPPELAAQGLNRLMNGDPDGAIQVFHRIEKQDSESPLGYLLEADAVWWKIYYATGNLIDPDVFDVVSATQSPYDAHFKDLINLTIHKARQRIESGQDIARNYLYEGMAYALKARLDGLRAQDLATARAGKKMRSLLLAALKYDPNLADADLGVGLYNYFVDTLPSIIKLLRWLIGLPGGSRSVGLQQLELAAEKGTLTRAEAQFYLAKDYSRPNEQQYQLALEGFQKLAAEYPRNGLWKLLVASLEIRLGRTAEGEALYREVLRETAGSKSEVGGSLHRAALKSLERLHPGEKFK